MYELDRFNRDRGNSSSSYGRSNVSKHRSESDSRNGSSNGGNAFRSSNRPPMDRRDGGSSSFGIYKLLSFFVSKYMFH